MVTLTALPRLGYAFTGWSGLPSGATTSANSASFPMPTSDLDVTADFATASSVFSGPVGSGATFHGLIRPESGTPTANSTVGFLSGTLTIPTGGFVGSVLMDGVTQPINATFHGNGSCVFNVGRTRLNELAFGGKVLTLRMNSAGATITAQVTSGGMTSSGLARRAVYSSTNPVPATLLNASATSGLATVAFPAKEQIPSRPTASYPQGDGFATATLSNLGVVTLTATLADNTTFTATSALVEGNECPVFGQILTPGSATQRGGSFSGTLKFDSSLVDSDLTGSGLLWIRPALTQLTGTTAAALATQLYTDGWPAGLTIDALGTLYNRTLSVQSSLDLGAANIVTGNGKLESADGKLPTPVIKTNFNITGNTVAKIPIADPSFTLTVNATTGSFSGTFRPTWTSPTLPTFRGIILQKGANRGGFGFFLSNIPADLDPESGGVTLSKP